MSNDIYNTSCFIVETSMVQSLLETIQGWLWNGSLGGYILGNSRVGKSTAIRFLSNKVSNRFGEIIPFHKVTIPRRDTASTAGIFKIICNSLNMKLKPRVTANDMANDLVHYFSELAFSNKSKQVVIVVDEMQRLKINQIEVFNELHDCLVDFKVNLSVIFVGNSKTSNPLISQIKTPECDHIWGRFFKHEYMFHGIRNHSELMKVLSEYDLEHTQQFMPKAFSSGWRVQELSHLIWEVYIENFKTKLTIQSWGMQYFTAMMRVLLVDYLPAHGIEDEEKIKQMIFHSIEASGLVEELVRLNND